MKGIPILIVLMIVMTATSGCFSDSDDSVGREFIDESGNVIQNEGGTRYFTGNESGRIGLDAEVSGITPLKMESGVVNSISIDGSGTGAMVLPNFTFAVLSGEIQNDTIIIFTAPTEIHILVAPFLNESSHRTILFIEIFGKDRLPYSFRITKSDDPLVSGQYWYDLEVLVTDNIDGYNGRYVGEGSPQLERAAVFFRDIFDSFGLDARIERYPIPGQDVQVVNVVAYHWGENRNEWVVIGGHYDVAPPPSYLGTWEGAYDNTAGTNAVVSAAKGISQFGTNKTIVFGLWSGEEEGLHGADEFVKNLPPDVTVHANINLDMVGLVYPSPGKRFQGMTFPNENASATEHPHFFWYMNHTIHDVLGLPRDKAIFDIHEGGSSGSDHTPFYRAGIPAVFYHSGPVSNYHTPGDNLDNLIADAGSVDLLIAGVSTALWIVFFTTIFLDGDGYVHPA